MKKTRIVGITIGLLLLGLIAAVGWRWIQRMPSSERPSAEKGEKKETGEKESAVELNVELQKNAGLKVEAAVTRDWRAPIELTAVVGADETRMSHVRLLARGRIDKVLVRAGDRVAAGDVLFDYDNLELAGFITAFAAAHAALDKANNDAEVAQHALDRSTKLVDLGAIPQSEHERRNAEVKNAAAAVALHKAEVAQAESQLKRFGINSVQDIKNTQTMQRAPFAGVVLTSNVATGELHGPDEDVMTIGDLRRVWVQADVYERDMAAASSGQRVQVRVDAYPEKTFSGRVTYISDVLDPKTRTAKLRCEVDNAGGELKVGMFARINLPGRETRQAVAIPADAVQRIDNEPVVFVREGEERFEKRSVTLGDESEGWMEIKKGIKAGELVVTQGSFAVKSQLLKGTLQGEKDEAK